MQVEYDPDSLEILENGATISLAHWKMDRYLKSHDVASPTDSSKYEVAGFSNNTKRNKTEVLKEVNFLNFSEIDEVGLVIQHIPTHIHLN